MWLLLMALQHPQDKLSKMQPQDLIMTVTELQWVLNVQP